MLIGVDGGATGVRAHEVLVTPDGFAPGQASAARTYPEPTADALVDCAARCILEVAGDGATVCGVAMPGLKTDDGRGVARMHHGPAIPDYLDRLEQRLSFAVYGLFGDGLVCGVGEDLAPGGLFRDVRDAYYIGGGTGVAECLKRDGKVVGMEGVPRAWELGLEEAISVKGINRRHGGYADEADVPALAALAELIERRLPLQRVVIGQRLADLLDPARVEARVPVVSSRLRAAPAIGAAALAHQRCTSSTG